MITLFVIGILVFTAKLVHFALVNDMDQKDMVIDFRIFVENEKT